jgi:3-dehydroquinate synthase
MTVNKTIGSLGYQVVIGENCLAALQSFLEKKKYSRHFILCDENTFQHCLPELLNECYALHEAELIEIESGEENKNLSICIDILRTLTEGKADRSSVLINLGGGVIGDMGGFVASVFKRGFDFINVPTTLLAMADASVGGKTGVDFDGLKNHIGTITQPAGVFIYPKFLETLPSRHVLSGLAELIKAGLIADKKLFEETAALKHFSFGKAKEIIFKGISIKNKIVKKDPAEKNIRKALNFGHTIGHAIEAFSLTTAQPLLHGEAVALGMLAEAKISYDEKLISKAELSKIQKVIGKFFGHVKMPKAETKALLALMQQDKKNSGDGINFTLLQGIGKAKINVQVPESLIVNALNSL